MLWGRVAKYVLWNAKGKWKARGWGLSAGGKNDNEYVLRGMMWAENCRLFSDIKERLVCMVSGIIRRAAAIGHGTQTRVAVVEKQLQR